MCFQSASVNTTLFSHCFKLCFWVIPPKVLQGFPLVTMLSTELSDKMASNLGRAPPVHSLYCQNEEEHRNSESIKSCEMLDIKIWRAHWWLIKRPGPVATLTATRRRKKGEEEKHLKLQYRILIACLCFWGIMVIIVSCFDVFQKWLVV